MRRKLVKQGSSTMMISLPYSWIQEQGLQKGDEVLLDAMGNDLVISADSKVIGRETSISIDGLDESFIRVLLTTAYRKGYDRISVVMSGKDHYTLIQSLVQRFLLGFEIIQQRDTSVIIESVSEPSIDHFDTMLQKVFLNIDELLVLIGDDIFKGRKVKREIIEDVEDRIQRYDHFCRRVLSKRKSSEVRAEFLWTFLTLLVHGQRELYKLFGYTSLKKSSFSLEYYVESISKMIQCLRQGYFDRSKKALFNVHSLYNKTIDKGFNQLRRTRGDEIIVLHCLLASIRQFYLASSPLTGVVF
ncbi:MAG TPA: hypothetical protein VJK51_04905 [Candidatus Nanoarchaeia archaeon]|nr:hypothetical protein [Candidatus Nanoarchaeia archaeon]